ncbi:MAG: UDP-N-acetylmuramate dehydrogenase [bacterium]
MMAAKSVSDVPFNLQGLRGKLSLQEHMAKHTSWRVGGPARFFYVPADRDDVVELIKRVPESIQISWIGLGSNLLVRDGGIDGLVIKTAKALSKLELKSARQIYAEVGVSCAKVARYSVANQLTGAEFLAGVPGSFGGALAMNAGAFGGETWALVDSIECVNREGICREFKRDDVSYGYRKVDLPKGYSLLSGMLQLAPDANFGGGNGKDRIKSFLAKRSASQPVQTANAGSVFKNPEGHYAAKIIEQLGLKGRAIGGARFSEVHANFIVNEGGASAANIEDLIELARGLALTRIGVNLETEVRILGSRK